ncbi:hypothetical protein SEUBUCD646_0I01690 [Saccharomyces eubayanus]|uniref:t-SNARE coiled-coil homology domain-containing protein n=1 Tax=Saccharomyces eubayanus TaxID=1080349 RepID=A0ABN8VSB2_SACEU|nr:BET1-like protein [Saccharomyces eubayanus]KOG98884.1 BET1-like protein [Saccharomyces eubayanus]CAI2040796.1 hypothetical protein SEUBUCD650_0I01680 [Saccharomyces eubayanus]CAI2051418.1 hypothetical protein SEUBUCD646_0I01690 [Saccharomyces eubayanus]
MKLCRFTGGNAYQRDTGRTQLFGTPDGSSNLDDTASSSFGSTGKLDYSQSNLASLESQSEEQMGAMGQRIKALKSLSLRMGDEIRGSNHTIDQLGDTFHNTSVKLKRTFSSMMEMARRSGISIKTWLIIFFFVGLLFFWVWII